MDVLLTFGTTNAVSKEVGEWAMDWRVDQDQLDAVKAYLAVHFTGQVDVISGPNDLVQVFRVTEGAKTYYLKLGRAVFDDLRTAEAISGYLRAHGVAQRMKQNGEVVAIDLADFKNSERTIG